MFIFCIYIYKPLRNQCNNLLRKAKSTYHKNLLNENSLSPKKFWNVIKNIFPTKVKGTTPKTSNKDVIANKFSGWFSTIVTSLKQKAMPLKNLVWGEATNKRDKRTDNVFSFKYVSVIFVKQQLKGLKRSKATGIDNLPPALLKDSADAIAKPLCHVINLSLRSGDVPTTWKQARVVPIHKSGPTDAPENFRPISILPAMSRILEKAVHKQLSMYFENNNLLSKSQFGFRKGRSTESATVLCCDTIRKAAGQGKLTGAVFLDLTHAFDTINHGTLLNKLVSYGVSNKEIAWFESYMFLRTQIVDIDTTMSDEKPLLTGVPQGTILGPLLFIIFFNDFQEVLVHSQVIQYADDTVILFSHSDLHTIIKALNEDLENISNYCYKNELLLNLKKGKTESMIFGTAKRIAKTGDQFQVHYRSEPINHVSSYKYLGNVLDPALSLNTDFDSKYKKAVQRLRLMSRLRPYLDMNAATKIYCMMIMPIITYCCQLHASLTATKSKQLSSISKRAAQIINNNDATIPDVEIAMRNRNCLFVKKCLDKGLCENFENYFRLNEHNLQTRNNKAFLLLPRVKLEFERKSFYFFGAKQYNDLPCFIRKKDTFNSFKSSLLAMTP